MEVREHIEAVQRMQDYIQAHLEERITPQDLALASHFSPWYARRLFIRYTGLSPACYLRKLRLSQSALRLRDRPSSIAQVAFAMGFGSVDGYQRAFFREFGCNPNEYASAPMPLYLFTPYGVKSQQTERSIFMKQDWNRPVSVRVVERGARKVILRRGVQATEYFSYCEEVGCDVWGLLKSLPSLTGEPVCLWLPAAYRAPGTSEYVQGAEVAPDYAGAIPEGCDVIDLPAARYLCFQGQPFAEEDYACAIAEVRREIERCDLAALSYAWDPSQPRMQLEPVGSRGYIELVAVR